MQNEAQYDLVRKAAKIYALSSNNLDKYEYLTGEDLGLKASSIEQSKFEYSPLGKTFNMGLNKKEKYKKEGLFKRLKNIENAKKNRKNIGSIPLIVSNYLKSLSQETKDLMDEIEDADNDIDYNKLLFIGSNKEKFNFNIFSTPLNFLLDKFNGKFTLKKAEINQRDLNKKIEELKYNYKPKDEKEKEEINEVLIHANDMLEYGDKIIDAFKNGTFSSEHI